MTSLALALRPRGHTRSQVSLATRAVAAIRRAGGTVLAAGAATPVLGAELVTNGDFSNGTTGWASSSSTLAVTSGELVVTATSSTQPSANRAFTVTPNVPHMLTIRCIADTANTIAKSARVRIGSSASGGSIYSGPHEVTANGVYLDLSVTFTPLVSTAYVLLEVGSASAYGNAGDKARFDNIIVKEILGYTYGNQPTRNFFDSAGTDILDSVTQVDQPVGLVLDGAGTVGVELAGLTTAWQSYGTGISLSGGQMIFTSVPTGQFALRGTPLAANKTYECELVIPAISGGGISMFVGGGASISTVTAPGTYRAVLKATSVDGPYLWVTSGTVTAVVTVASCREITGNHASQPTVGSKPTLRRGLVNQLTQSDSPNGTADTSHLGGLVTASTLTGYGGALAFGHDGTTLSYALKAYTPTVGVTYTLAVVVKMDDGLAPSFTSSAHATSGNSLVLVPFNTATNPLTYTTSNLGGGFYLVACSLACGGVFTGQGVYKYSTNDSRTFKVTRYGFFTGSYTAAKILAAGGIPLTTTAPASSALGNYWWQFDPAAPGDYLQTGITTGNEGWVCAGVTFSGAVANNETVFSTGAGNAAMKGVWMLRLANDQSSLRMGIGNGTVLTQPVSNSKVLLNTPRVVDGGWTASSVFAAVDGTETTMARTGDATPPATTMNIGCYIAGIHHMTGPMSCFVYCPTLPPAADRALIRAWVAKQQGQTL